MNTSGIIIRITMVLIGIAACIMYLFLAYEWLYIGHGLNPWIAFPLAVISVMAPVAFVIWEAIENIPEE